MSRRKATKALDAEAPNIEDVHLGIAVRTKSRKSAPVGSPRYVAENLTPRLLSTIAWLAGRWPYPFKDDPLDDVQQLVELRLAAPPNEETWGELTAAGQEVWSLAKPTWEKQHAVAHVAAIRRRVLA